MLLILTILSLSFRLGISIPPEQSVDQSAGRCPTVSVSCVGASRCKEPLIFKASVKDADPTVAYQWTVSGGQILRGQGTSMIEVRDSSISRVVKSKGSPFLIRVDNRALTAFVELKGVSEECQRSATASISLLGEHLPLATPIDQFSSLTFTKVKPRLDKIAEYLRAYAGTTASIIVDGKWSLKKRAMDYLVGEKGIESGRVTLLEKPTKTRLRVTMHIVPQGAVPPK